MLVSICIPTFEKPDSLKIALDNIFIQDYTSFEVIISDDSSSDVILDICNIFSSDKIRYYRHESTGNAIDNWNNALSLASGNIITLLHDDDYYVSESVLSEVVKKFITSEFGLILLNSIHYDLDLVIGCNRCVIPENTNELIYKNTIGAPSILFFKKEYLKFYDPKFKWYVDIDYYFRITNNFTNNYFVFNRYYIAIQTSLEGRITNVCLNDKKLVFKELIILTTKYINFKYNSSNLFYVILKYIFKIIFNL